MVGMNEHRNDWVVVLVYEKRFVSLRNNWTASIMIKF